MCIKRNLSVDAILRKLERDLEVFAAVAANNNNHLETLGEESGLFPPLKVLMQKDPVQNIM